MDAVIGLEEIEAVLIVEDPIERRPDQVLAPIPRAEIQITVVGGHRIEMAVEHAVEAFVQPAERNLEARRGHTCSADDQIPRIVRMDANQFRRSIGSDVEVSMKFLHADRGARPHELRAIADDDRRELIA